MTLNLTNPEQMEFSLLPDVRSPLVLSYGIGVDSTAILAGWHARGIRPDVILTADTGGEKEETYAYLAVISEWLKKVGFPAITLVRYEAKNFKYWPPYRSLEENCLTNGTLPSLAFGFHSCSLKWKVEPQDAFLREWAPAKAAWDAGLRVRKAIGYDAGKRDSQRYAHAKKSAAKADDSWMWEYVYPLQEWGWDRERCIAEIKAAGLPVPVKSACFFCPATKPHELHEMSVDKLERIVRLEARAAPRLEGLMNAEQLEESYKGKLLKVAAKREAYDAKVSRWHARCAKAVAKGRVVMPKMPNFKMPKKMKVGEGCQGLWRRATKSRPAMMSDYIRSANLLPAARIAEIVAEAPVEIVAFQDGFARAKAAGVEAEFMAEHSMEDYRSPENHGFNFCPLGRIGGEDLELDEAA